MRKLVAVMLIAIHVYVCGLRRQRPKERCRHGQGEAERKMYLYIPVPQLFPVGIPMLALVVLIRTLNLLFYDTLVNNYTNDGSYVGELATDWKVSADGLMWTFNLRKGVKFHNGEDFDASSVVCTFNRILKDPLCSTLGGTYKAIKSADAADNYTVVLKLSTPICSDAQPTKYACHDSAKAI